MEPEERHIFMFNIPVTYTLQRTYQYQSSTPSESLSPLSYILNAIISHHILTLDTAHISTLQTRLQAAAVIDRACSLTRTGE